LCRLNRSRSGISTILGTLIFVGILFTSAIPLFMYVNQVNSYYNKTVTELNRFDQQRGEEDLEVYAYPVFPNDTATLNIFIRNRCTLTITIMRAWVNDTTPIPTGGLPLQLSGMSDVTIEGIQIPSVGDFDVWLVTTRGNVFASLTNTLQINGTSWSGGNPPYSINIVIDKKTGFRSYNVTARLGSRTYSTTGSSTGYNLLLGLDIGYDLGVYNVTVTRTAPSVKVIYSQQITITLQNPSPWAYVEDKV